MKHALFIAYEFPPFADSGVYRTVKFTKYLHRFGWRVTVLTVAFNEKDLANSDNGLLDELPESTKVVRASVIDPYQWYRRLGGRRAQGDHSQKKVQPSGRGVLETVAGIGQRLYDSVIVPDAKIGWYPDCAKKGAEVCQGDRPDVLFSSSPRETAHLVARKLSAKFDIPWVADFRDPWVEAFFAPKRPGPVEALNRRLERAVVKNADAITVAWDGISELLEKHHPDLCPLAKTTLTNGFDPEDYETAPSREFDGFTIVYTGRFHEGNTSPELFLQGVSLLLEEAPDLAAKTKVVLVGPVQEFVVDMVNSLGLSNNVQFVGRVSHEQAIASMKGAPVLYFQGTKAMDGDENGMEQQVVSGKLYEYMGAGNPILALVEGGSPAERILKGYHSSVRVTTQDAGDVMKGIRELYQRWQDASGEEDRIVASDTYNRITITRNLANIFDRLVLKGGNADL